MQAVAAEAVGIERASLSMIERGRDTPGRALMAALAQFYGVTMDYLEHGTPLPGDQLAGHGVKDISETSLVHFWRLLERPEQERTIAFMADMIGSRAADSLRTNRNHEPPSASVNEP